MNKNGENLKMMSSNPEDPAKFTQRLFNVGKRSQQELLIQNEAEKAQDYDDNNIQSYTNANDLYYSDMHALINGITGAGKTTLLSTIEHNFLKKTDATVLHRDDGGLEFLNIARYFDTRVFIPDCPDISLEPIGFKCDIHRFKEPEEIINAVWEYNYRYNVIVFDVFCPTYKQLAKFYSSFFQKLIFELQQKRKADKKRVVLAMDELNDIIAPRGKATPEMATTSKDVERNLKKVRKHEVQMIGDTHRFNQIGLDTRSQFQQVYIKKSYGYDLYDFLSKGLITSNKATFWKVIKKATRMPPNQFILFDRNQNFDLYEYKDIPRPNPKEVDIEALGSLPVEVKETKGDKVFRQRFVKAMEELKNLGLSEAEACRRVNISPTNYNQIKKRQEDED